MQELGREACLCKLSVLKAALPLVQPVSYTHLDVYKRQGSLKAEEEARYLCHGVNMMMMTL